jgi:hypothetical protein
VGFLADWVGVLCLVAMGDAPLEGNRCECGEGIEVRRSCRMKIPHMRLDFVGCSIDA